MACRKVQLGVAHLSAACMPAASNSTAPCVVVAKEGLRVSTVRHGKPHGAAHWAAVGLPPSINQGVRSASSLHAVPALCAAQVSLLRDLFKKALGAEGSKLVDINTIDGYQVRSA